MNQPWWRKWHRWIGFAAFPFLLFAAVTGVIAGVSESLSEDEEAREAARDRVSAVSLPAPTAAWNEPMQKALEGAAQRAPSAPIDKITVDYKSDPQTVVVFLGKPGGGEDKKLFFNAQTGEFLREESYEDKPFLVRLHSGEAFGDWGLVLGMGWGICLIALLASGLVIYLAMRKPGRTGIKRLFW